MDKKTPDIPLEEALFYLIERTMRQSNRYMHRVFAEAEVDLTKDQWLVLKKVYDAASGISPLEIAKVLGKEAASMTRILDIMERKALLTREPNPADRRSSLIRPTESGEDLYQRVLPLIKHIRAQAIAELSPETVKTLRKTLRKIRKNLE